LQNILVRLTNTAIYACFTRARRLFPTALGALGAALVIGAAAYAQPSSSPPGNPGDFFRGIVGEWIGTCEQSTDGEQAENKYFHAVVTQVDANTFESRFKYYRWDKETGSPLHVGDATIVTTVEPDGSATNRISGRGTILVHDKPQTQQHEMLEVVTSTSADSLQSRGSGKIQVSGMPFGLGKNGRIRDAECTWSLNNGVLTIQQTLKAEFRILFFKRVFTVRAQYTAMRGSDIVGLMTEEPLVAAESTGADPSGS